MISFYKTHKLLSLSFKVPKESHELFYNSSMSYAARFLSQYKNGR
jgi:hypothetical protein